MACDDCKSGFRWGGTPTGKVSTLAGLNTYVAGNSKAAAIMIVHDLLGWTFNNARLLADHFAAEVGATVYVPDFFDGEVVTEDIIDDPEKWAAFNLPDFIQRQSKEKLWPNIKAAAQALKAEYPKVGAMGYCYGGWACFRLAADPSLVDAMSVAHPSLMVKEEIVGVDVPVQILAPETDQQLTPELKEYANRIIPFKKVPYEYVYFPGLVHGFAGRGNREDKLQREGLERAKRCAVNWFKEFLIFQTWTSRVVVPS